MKLYFNVIALCVPTAAFTMRSPALPKGWSLNAHGRDNRGTATIAAPTETDDNRPMTYGLSGLPGIISMPLEERLTNSKNLPVPVAESQRALTSGPGLQGRSRNAPIPKRTPPEERRTLSRSAVVPVAVSQRASTSVPDVQLRSRNAPIPEFKPVPESKRGPISPPIAAGRLNSSMSPLSQKRNTETSITPSSPVTSGGSVNLSDKALEYDEGMIKVQGNSLKTWAFQTPLIDRVHVIMKTEGRPLNADVELWQGPNNVPQRIKVFIEEGLHCPFNAVIQTPGGQNSVAIQNTNSMEFPFIAAIEAEVDGSINLGLKDDIDSLNGNAPGRTVQGRAVYTKPFAPEVQSVQILLKTDGRPLSARIELLQGPNNIKQALDVYCEDGQTRPFFIIIETPEPGCVVRIVNTATLEFPLTAVVEPYTIDDSRLRDFKSFFIVD